MVFFPRARSRSRMRCWAARSSLTGTTSWFEATAAELPFVLRCCHRRTTEGETASSRANSESVSYWRTTRAICSCLNCVVKKRRPSDPRRCVSIRRPSVEKSNYPSQTASSNWGTEHPPPVASPLDDGVDLSGVVAAMGWTLERLGGASAFCRIPGPCPSLVSLHHHLPHGLAPQRDLPQVVSAASS